MSMEFGRDERELGTASGGFLVEAAAVVGSLGFLRDFFGGSKGWSKIPGTRGLELSLSVLSLSMGWALCWWCSLSSRFWALVALVEGGAEVGDSGTEWKETWTILSCMMPFGPTVGGATSSVRLTVVVEGVVEEGKGFKDEEGRLLGDGAAAGGGCFADGVVVVVVDVDDASWSCSCCSWSCNCAAACCCCCCCCWLRDDLRLARWPCVCGCVCGCVCVCVCCDGVCDDDGVVCPPSRCIMLPCGLFSPRPCPCPPPCPGAFLARPPSSRRSPAVLPTPLVPPPPLFPRDGCFRVALIFLNSNFRSSALFQRCVVGCRSSGTVGRGGEQNTTYPRPCSHTRIPAPLLRPSSTCIQTPDPHFLFIFPFYFYFYFYFYLFLFECCEPRTATVPKNSHFLRSRSLAF